jgi:orotidine-5'-phosphate decarboxylase
VGFRESLASSSRARDSRLILALDITGPSETRLGRATRLLSGLSDDVAGVKVNFHLLLPGGLDGIREVVKVCSDGSLPLIADIKLNDIESTNLDAAELIYSSGFDAIIANPFVGYREGLAGTMSRARELGKGVILLVYMSHAGAREGYGLKVGSEPLYRLFAQRAKKWRADGAIVSSKSPEIIAEVRGILSDDQLIFSPGIGTQGGEARKAARAGTDYAIVGRSITEAGDPRAAAREFNRQLASAGAGPRPPRGSA